MKYMNFFPGGGTSVIEPCFLRFWSLLSNWIWATEGDVWAVKVNVRCAWLLFLITWLIMLVFPVPVGEVIKTGFNYSMNFYIIEE